MKQLKEKPVEIRRYLNPVAQMYLHATQAYTTYIAGRGNGKSFVNGAAEARLVAEMPRSLGLFTSPTYSMIYTKTLIPMKAAWEQHFGYLEGIHYVVGKAPPKHFERPYHSPQRYENVVSFWNGRAIVFGSFDRPSTISGGSYDSITSDECYLIEKQDYDDFVIPTARGTHPIFKDCPYHLQHRFTSSMPFRNQGNWLLDYRMKALQNPKQYFFIGWHPEHIGKQLGSTWMNVRVLGRKAIEQMEMEMNDLSNKVMIRNEQVANFGNIFYAKLTERHWYTARYGDNIHILGSALERNATHDISLDDYDPDLPIHGSHDWGVFNCLTIDQQHAKEIRFINTMHVHNPQTIDDLADHFIQYYRFHRNKLFYQWGDTTGNNKQANKTENYFEQFANRLRANGWRVIQKKTGYVEHVERHRFIAVLHSEEDKRFPIIRYNKRCVDLKIALESTQMKDTKKDKSSETNQSVRPQHATHYTDAHDYRLYHALRHIESDSGIDHTSFHL